MKLRTLKGKEFKLDLRPSQHKMRTEEACKSKIQFTIGQELRKKYPADIILEEVYLPDGFYLDFFIPVRKICVEIQGRQHNEFVPFFHGTKAKFAESQARDSKKLEWCKINGIKMQYVNDKGEWL